MISIDGQKFTNENSQNVRLCAIDISDEITNWGDENITVILPDWVLAGYLGSNCSLTVTTGEGNKRFDAYSLTIGAAGADGIHCWDLDGVRVNDDEEDINDDGNWDALNCQGAPEKGWDPQHPVPMCVYFKVQGIIPPVEYHCPKIVFVTSTSPDGNLGGVTGANQICQDLWEAVHGSKGMTFLAWISDGIRYPTDGTFTKSNTGYIRLGGAVVAESWEDHI